MSSRTVLITGANRGIGFAIVQALAQRSPTDQYLLACRSHGQGQAAIEKLRALGIESRLDVIELDVSSNESLEAAVQEVRSTYKKLDILVNNAGIAMIPKADLSDFREAYNAVYNTNVTSVALSMSMFLPLMRDTSSDPRIINVSSARGSLGLSSSGKMPPTVAIPYSISKSALNALTLEYARTQGNEGVIFQCISPGHCKTDFNGNRGTKDPLAGAQVVVELIVSEKGKFQNGFWQMEGDEKEPTPIAW